MLKIDTAFVVTNFEEVDLEDNPDRFLCRYEFYEILVRMAKDKYLESKRCKTLAAAVSTLLEDNVYQNSDFVISWQEWRENELWTLSIDDLFKVNLDTIRSIYFVSD